MKKQTKQLAIGLGLLAVIAAAILLTTTHNTETPAANTPDQTADVVTPEKPTPPIVKDEDVQTGPYRTITIKADPIKEITAAVGAANVANILKLNRINSNFIKAGSVVVIPEDPSQFDSLSPFPTELPDAAAVPKMMMVSQRVQAFGLYENGKLIRWGPVSTGKQATPTASKLYFTNWKGKEVRSSFDDEWLLKWNFNLDNKEGIGMHQYEMPGFPASHSCIRMFATDAEWIYDWADQWILSDDEQSVLGSGTPVIVFGTYAYGKTAPWKNLPKDAAATTLSDSEVEKALSSSLSKILEEQQQRIDYLAS